MTTTRETIDLSSVANDGSGDTLRSGGQKINRNFGKIFYMLGSDSDYLSESIRFDSNGIIYSGNTSTTIVHFEDPDSDRNIYFPDANGTLVTDSSGQTLWYKKLVTPIIEDSNGSMILEFEKQDSAVNYMWVRNSATGSNPKLEAKGADTNVTLDVFAKGSGSVRNNKQAVQAETIDSDGAASLDVGYTIFNSASALAVSLNNGTVTGEKKIFSNRGAGVVTVTPASFGQGTSFDMAQASACELIWDSASWYIYSAYNDSDITVT